MTTSATTPATHEEITRRAFLIWCESGRRPGMADHDWHAAERELQREREHNALSNRQDAQDATGPGRIRQTPATHKPATK